MTVATINKAIRLARAEANIEAKLRYDVTMGRGVQVYVHVNGQRSDEPVIDTTRHLTLADCAEVLIAYNVEIAKGNQAKITIGGGFNGADSVKDFHNDIYDPWVSFWELDVVPSGKKYLKLAEEESTEA